MLTFLSIIIPCFLVYYFSYDNGKEEKRILIIGIFNISLYGHGDSRIHDFTVMRYNRETARQLMEINGSPSGT